MSSSNRKKQVSYKDFKDHLALIEYYNSLKVTETMTEATKIDPDNKTAEQLSTFLSKLNSLESHLQDVVIGIAQFAIGKEKLKTPYNETILDSDYAKLPKELQKYFGTEKSYQEFQTIRGLVKPLKEKVSLAIRSLENIITTKLANDSPTDLSRAGTIKDASAHDDRQHHTAPALSSDHHSKKHKGHKNRHEKEDIGQPSAAPPKAAAPWKNQELSDELLRFTASQFNAQYSFLSGNGPQKQLANILLSNIDLNKKHEAVYSFRKKHGSNAPLMEKIIISLSINREMIANDDGIAWLNATEIKRLKKLKRTPIPESEIKTTWFTSEDINQVISLYTTRRRGFFSLFTSSNKRADSLITLLKSEASLEDKAAAIEYYIQIKDGRTVFNSRTKTVESKLGFFTSEDRLKNILTSMKNGKNYPVPDQPRMARANE